MIDAAGFRANVGIILVGDDDRVFWAKLIKQQSAWQFPQGGINKGEEPVDAMYRELYEETGLAKGDVELLGSTQGWMRYRLPKRYQRSNQKKPCIGQKQKWFLLRLVGDPSSIRFDAVGSPEFSDYQWVSYWYPVSHVISFKRDVYRRALSELAPLLKPANGK